MPTYEYRCTRCKHEFEQFQSMKDKSLKTCPACKKASLERLIGVGAAVIFKGSGFYQTDYRSEAYRKAAQADSSSGGSKDSTDKPATAEGSGATNPKAETANTPTDKSTGQDKNSSKDQKSGKDKSTGSDTSSPSSSEKSSETSKSQSSRKAIAMNAGSASAKSRSSSTTKSSPKKASPAPKSTASKSSARATKR